MFNAKSLIHRL